MHTLARLLRELPLLLLSPILLLGPIAALALADLLYLIRRPRRRPSDSKPSTQSVSVVIPNWNGRDLLEKYLPSVISATKGHPDNEIIVVDNGSTDGSAEYVKRAFPQVRLLPLETNLGFGGGSNEGFRAANNDIVVLLNSDMRVDPDFLAPLLEGFSDDKVFSVSCQIFFTDPNRVREETGLTQSWWANGALRVRHRLDHKVTRRFPCSYGGGGSSAFDRRKFLELGGFDPLLAPFYLEDTDLGFMAWKRGWKALYEPRSRVSHEHRGTIGKRFTDDQIQAVLQKNFILFCWKNIHEWRRLGAHFAFTFSGAIVSLLFGRSPERATLPAMWCAFRQLPVAVTCRWRARRLAILDDSEAFRRPLGGYFRDRFRTLPPEPDPLRVLFVSPYPICPPVHGGAVFMLQTCRQLARLCELHLIVMIDQPRQEPAHAELAGDCASAEFVLRLEGQPQSFGSIVPHAIREFDNDNLRWLIHRQILMHEIDVVQLEYLPMGQYAGAYRQLACTLFEHDVYSQSIGRALARTPGLSRKATAAYEYMRALRYELRLLPQLDQVQVCSPQNAAHVASFLPHLRERLDDGSRAGIDVSRYRFLTNEREPFTMLFVGSFRHQPNHDALNWFLRRVLPRVLAARAEARLIVVGSDPPAMHSLPELRESIELRGYVEDIYEPLSRYAVFICPILSGSGMRVKLLEAFAVGIPVVATPVGAEGLADQDGHFCALANAPDAFAGKILHLFDNPDEAAEMARRARREVEANRDMPVLTGKLVDSYRRIVAQKRRTG